VSNTTAIGRAWVIRTVMYQAVGTAILAALFAAAGFAAAQAALTGGLIVAVGTLILGGRMFVAGIAPAPGLVFGALLGMALKWLWLVLALWFVLAVLRLQPLPLLAGVATAYAAFGVATLRSR
jgi:hypothetical protein